MDTPCYCSSAYRYELSEAHLSGLADNGVITINIYGVNFFENENFEYPVLHLPLELIYKLKEKEEYLELEYLDEEKNKLVPVKMISAVKKDVMYDIVTYMMVSMREPKKLYYAYRFLANYYGYSKKRNKLNYDFAMKPMLNKCREEIFRLRNIDINLKDLAFTKVYNTKLKDQENNEKSFILYKKKKAKNNSIFASLTGKDMISKMKKSDKKSRKNAFRQLTRGMTRMSSINTISKQASFIGNRKSNKTSGRSKGSPSKSRGSPRKSRDEEERGGFKGKFGDFGEEKKGEVFGGPEGGGSGSVPLLNLGGERKPRMSFLARPIDVIGGEVVVDFFGRGG
jgi:hypothetical protein